MRRVRSIFLALVILGPIIASERCQAQSTFIFANYDGYGTDAPVFDADGNRLSGTNYLAMLYGGGSVDSLQPATLPYSSQIIAPVPFDLPLPGGGYFYYNWNGGPGYGFVQIATAVPGSYAWLQVRAWDARLGPTYESVVALGLGGYGESSVFYTYGGNPSLLLPTPPEPLRGLQSFSLRPVVPEPSTWALLALGAMGVWSVVQRRR